MSTILIDEPVFENIKIPKKIFIVPYRNRVQHKFFFTKYMSFILEDMNDYEVYFSHQNDQRTFNRGAAKNIGFIAMKNKYPNDYKNITFIFNDIDTIPFYKLFDYETNIGTVKHYYGYEFALGGIVVIKGSDFENINGFPCYWGWGLEDDILQKRCIKNNINIDRSTFYKIGSPEILQLFDGISRIITKKNKPSSDSGLDGIKSIKNLNYSIDKKSKNNLDNIYSVDLENFYYININTFNTYDKFENNSYYVYDLREPPSKIINPDKSKEIKLSIGQPIAKSMNQSTFKSYTSIQDINTFKNANINSKANSNVNVNIDNKIGDWTNISYYPTSKDRREILLKSLISKGEKIPQGLLNQIAFDNYNSNNNLPENTILSTTINSKPPNKKINEISLSERASPDGYNENSHQFRRISVKRNNGLIYNENVYPNQINKANIYNKTLAKHIIPKKFGISLGGIN